MTSIRVSLVDLYVLRQGDAGLECLALRRAVGGRCPGSWETVHGHIEEGERPWQAAQRELEEETGLVPGRLYNLSRVETFYQHRLDEVALVPVFVAFVPAGAAVRLGPEHDRHEWLTPAEATTRFAWPRERRALEDALLLLGSGNGGAVEDVLRVC
ncbi:MAG: NUDIX domain-containing protein [Gemmatimonadales bacterium]|nr:NUDIX domain-containing protein [Gemmatimonadales bacterium]MBA3556522.1 NUDIX domain-containing protein [Gemmatimonadales bacterium]